MRDRLGHFPLKNFWGPLAGVQASRWIADSAAVAAEQWQPDFFYIYLPHLDYAAQRNGPESVEADTAVAELDEVIGQLAGRLGAAYGEELLWLVAGEYAITPVDHVAYPNRVLREAGLLAVRDPRPASGCPAGGEELDLEASRAWAMVDHQFSHVFVSGGDPALAQRVAEVFRGQPGIAEVLLGEDLARYGLDHPRSGEVVLISRAAELAGVLLVAFRRPCAGVGPHGRYSPQARLRPGGTVLRPGVAGHPAWRRRGSRDRTGRRRWSGPSEASSWPPSRFSCLGSWWPTPRCLGSSCGISACRAESPLSLRERVAAQRPGEGVAERR